MPTCRCSSASGWRATTPSDTGWANEIIYSTPSFGGLSANMHYQFGEVAGDSGPKNVGLSIALLQPDRSPPPRSTSVTRLATPTRPRRSPPPTGKPTGCSGRRMTPRWSRAFDHGKAKSDTPVPQAKAVSQGALRCQWGRQGAGGGGQNARHAGQYLGYLDGGLRLFPSKSTDVYAMYMRDRITSLQRHPALAPASASASDGSAAAVEVRRPRCGPGPGAPPSGAGPPRGGLQCERRIDHEHAAGGQPRPLGLAGRVGQDLAGLDGQRRIQPALPALVARVLSPRGRSCASGRGMIGYQTA